MQRRTVAGFTLLSVLFAMSAHADESLFGYNYGAETMPEGRLEWVNTLTHRWDKELGHYRADELMTELEYGVTDRLTLAGYLMFLDIKHEGAFPRTAEDGEVLYPDRDGSYFRGAKFNLKYNLLSPYLNDGFGLALMVEPSYITRFKVDGSETKQWEVELGALLQQNLLDDQWVLTANTIVARERRVLVEDDGFVEHEWEFYQTLGASWRLTSNWYAGLEARHHMDVLKNDDGDFKKNQYSTFVGPNLHYAQKDWWLTATFFKQVRGNPPYARSVGEIDGGADNGLHLDENEKYEFRLKVGYEY